MERRTELVIELLGKGYTNREVAAIAEISDSAVSQVAKEYEDKIAELSMESTIAQRAMDHKLDELEYSILQNLDAKLAFEPNTSVLLKAFQTINGAKRRSKGEGNTPSVTVNDNRTVVMQLPNRIKERVVFETNQRNEIVEVSGRNLATATQQSVNNELHERNERKLQLDKPSKENDNVDNRTLQASDF